RRAGRPALRGGPLPGHRAAAARAVRAGCPAGRPGPVARDAPRAGSGWPDLTDRGRRRPWEVMILRNADSPAVSAAERFEALYTGSYQEISGYVRRRVPPDAADDVGAQVFTVAWRRLGQVPGPPQDRLWLFGVARNCTAEHHRAATRRLRLRTRLSQEPAAVAHVPGPGGPDHDPGPVLAALASLKPRDREALQLVLWDELSHAEAAAVL